MSAIPSSTDSVQTNELRKIVTFRVDARTFGIDVAAVREIKGWHPATPLPHVPPHVRGVINLRGMILAVYDLRARIGLGVTAATPAHVILVVDVHERVAGLLVDAVSDIIDIPVSAIRPPPDVQTCDQMLSGVVIVGDDVVSLLSLDRAVDGSPLVTATNLSQEAA
ncbi:MAG: purine-binding chemotaxis protein CheW [Bosea sp.]|jgi:purine-binding chemotaxis protein CheW|nr:purine-binding chemotaxis protein CheW [Bosea sp. (in: a-proteobacteria)]